MIMPGDNVNMEVELITPIAMEEGLRFAIREGGRTVGAVLLPRLSNRQSLRPSMTRSGEVCLRRDESGAPKDTHQVESI